MGPKEGLAIGSRGYPGGAVVFTVREYRMHEGGLVTYLIKATGEIKNVYSWTWWLDSGQVLQAVSSTGSKHKLPKEWQEAYESMIAAIIVGD